MSSLSYLASLCWGMELQDPQAQKQENCVWDPKELRLPEGWICCAVWYLEWWRWQDIQGKTGRFRVPSSYTLVSQQD